MSSRSIATLAFLLAPAIVFAQSGPAQRRLDEISARGRALAAYQRAAWTASRQLLAKNPDPWKVSRYVAYHADSGWVVAFGRLCATRDTFYVSYIAMPAAVNGLRVDSLFEFEAFAEPGADTDFLVRAARAMDNAVMAHGHKPRAYTAAAIPGGDGDWFVYLMPSADAANVWPLGDDVRYRFSADGERLLEARPMHVGMVADGRGSALRDEPEDSDVFHVLAQRPSAPELVVTVHHRYVVAADGSIRFAQGKESIVGAAR
ncbi:MAG TPA: hypothetical protein VJO33_14560 [Gemmatimonadaceae bacterium]|nr:hypothetical protein [Gemmatimonadaceae bacterium]